jgi:hypothetical protein
VSDIESLPPKKLPAECASISYDLEYGQDTLEIHRDAASEGLAELQRSHSPLDGHAKATGRARYAGDIAFHPDDPVRKPLFAKAVRCPHAHATVVDIDDSKATLPEDVAIHVFADTPA